MPRGLLLGTVSLSVGALCWKRGLDLQLRSGLLLLQKLDRSNISRRLDFGEKISTEDRKDFRRSSETLTWIKMYYKYSGVNQKIAESGGNQAYNAGVS